MSGGGGNIYAPDKGALSGANANLSSLQGQNYSALSNYTPQVTSTAQGITSQYLNNPYAPYAQQGANATSAYGAGTLAPAQAGMAANLTGLGQQVQPAITSALNTYFSPNNDLYNYNLSQTIDQSNAINAMNGVSGSPYGAGLTDQAAQNFNRNWNMENAQLQNLGANTISSLYNIVPNAFTNASNIGTAGLNTFNQSYQLPSTTYTSNLAGDLSALSGQNMAVGGAADIVNSLSNSYQNYLNYGLSADQAKQAAQASALGGLGGLFGNILGMGQSGGGTVGGNFLGSIGQLLPSIGSSAGAASGAGDLMSTFFDAADMAAMF